MQIGKQRCVIHRARIERELQLAAGALRDRPVLQSVVVQRRGRVRMNREHAALGGDARIQMSGSIDRHFFDIERSVILAISKLLPKNEAAAPRFLNVSGRRETRDANESAE